MPAGISLFLRRFVFRMAEGSAKRVTGDEPQGTMGRVQTAGEATSRSLCPSRLPLRAHFQRDVWVRGRAGMKYTLERVWMQFRGTDTGSGETDIEVIGEYVASRSMNYGERGR